MTDRLRNDPSDPADHLTPADLLSDDPDTSVNPTRIRARTQSALSPSECSALRDALRGTDADAMPTAERLGIDQSRRCILNHYRGHCKHDPDSAPVRYINSRGTWVTDE